METISRNSKKEIYIDLDDEKKVIIKTLINDLEHQILRQFEGNDLIKLKSDFEKFSDFSGMKIILSESLLEAAGNILNYYKERRDFSMRPINEILYDMKI